MTLLRTRDNPEYKYTLAFLGEAIAVHYVRWFGRPMLAGCVHLPQRGQLVPACHRCPSPTWLGWQSHLSTQF